MKYLSLGKIVFSIGVSAMVGCGPGTDPPERHCLQLTEVETSTVRPAGVRTVFQLNGCDGLPISNLKSDDLTVRLDGEALQSEGGRTAVLNQNVDFAQYALLLLDLSDSIVDSKNLKPMVSAARHLVSRLQSQRMQVAIYRFAGPQYFAEVQGFTDDAALLDAALDDIAVMEGLGTTDLYGSIGKALDRLEGEGASDTLAGRNLIVFTDGTDEARESTFAAAKAACDSTDAAIFTIGLGGDVNQEELIAFGKDGFEWAENAEKLDAAFSKLTDKIETLAKSFYLLGVCSPRTAGIRDLALLVSKNNATGSLVVQYNATGFDVVDCDVDAVAYPCEDRECGSWSGFFCGICDAASFCNADNICQDACEDRECGDNEGVHCGDCTDQGDTYYCTDEGVCAETCIDVECGIVSGVDCGGCDIGSACTAENRCGPSSVSSESWSKIPGGVFSLGCDLSVDPSCGLDEAFHDVALDDFWIMTTEVTVEMIQSCIDAGACDLTELDTGGECNFAAGVSSQPINCITWTGLEAFCAYVGAHLPTESEWERAFRGDHDGTNAGYWIYPWGNTPSPSCARVVMNENGPGCGTGKTNSVGSLPAGGFDLFDMAGNTAEWTGDFYSETVASCGDEPCQNPTGPLEGDMRVIRGGAFDDMFVSSFRTAKRDKEIPTATSPAVGGRCVKR